MQSIQSKLSTGLLLSLIIAFSALWILVSISVQFMANEYIASRLEHDAEMLLNAINFDNNGVLAVDETRIDLIYNQPFSGHYYVINSGSQSINSRSLWDHKLKVAAVNTGQQSRTLQYGPDQQSLLFISGGYKKQGNRLTISIAEDLNPINKNINQFKYWFSAMAFGMLLILVLLQVFILRKSLKPLTKMHAELKLLQQGQLNKLNTESPSELQPLINEVNHLLNIMEQRLRRSRNALSDLAHAIKKPLTVIKQITDQDTIPDTTKTTLIKQTNDIYQISDHILKRARLAGHSHTGALFSFSDDLPALIKTLDMMYASKTLLLTSNVPDNVHCPVDREDMLELLGNLLDNAYKWAAHKIVLTVNINSDLHICIEDDGPGTNLGKISELSKRGVRMDEKIQGHGFGLAITTDIVNDYNGHISFKHSSDLGGFKADITLPLHQF
ncbi:MAG: GHKL domain-containing protein [Gammaproteobacteria bacterium]|nr:GHKL domain-containing protein [Gammaproteobacteria bacterium]